MSKNEDKNTRYFIDLDLATRSILDWDYGDRNKLVQDLPEPAHHRIFISKGQYNKLEQRRRELRTLKQERVRPKGRVP